MAGSCSSPDHPVTTHLHNNCHIISGTQQPLILAKVLLPKSQWPSRMIWAFPFVYQEFWYLKTFKSGQGSMISRDFAAKNGFNPGSDGFWIGETISSSGANQIGDGARREGKQTSCSPVACISWYLHPSCSLSQFLSSRLLPFSFNVGRLIWFNLNVKPFYALKKDEV